MVEKKYIKLGVAGLALAAVVIGLSVGLTQRNKNNKSASSSNAAETYSAYSNLDCESGYSHSGKSGKSGGGGSKGSKSSGGGSYSGSGKSGKSGGSKSSHRQLVVPGTEDYEAVKVNANKRRKLRNELVKDSGFEEDWVIQERFLSFAIGSYTGSYRYSHHSGKSGKSGGSKGAKSYGGGYSHGSSDKCEVSYDVCEHSGKSGKSGGGGSGKSGKSGGSKSGGRKLDVSSYEGSSDSSSKSGKSSGGGGGSKGSKSSSYGSAPSACSTYSHSAKSSKSDGGGSKSSKSSSSSPEESSYSRSKMSTTPATPAIIECICQDQDWIYDGSTCIMTCDEFVPIVGGPYGSLEDCCNDNFDGVGSCFVDECGFIIEPNETPSPSPAPTIGDTTTVATEAEIEFAEQTGDRPPN